MSHSCPPSSYESSESEDERMKKILDRDANIMLYSRSGSAGNFSDQQRQRKTNPASSASMAMNRRMGATSSSNSDSDKVLSDFGSDKDGDNGGLLATISSNCIPPRFIKTRKNGQRRSLLPMLLLSLILYGTISMVADVVNSIQALHEKEKNQRITAEESRFPGGFHSDGSSAAFSRDSIRAANPNQAQFQRSMDSVFSQETDGSSTTFKEGSTHDHSHLLVNIDRNYPTVEDIPIITEHILSTTFQHAIEHEGEIQPNEIPFFWSVGGTAGRGPVGRFPAEIAKCFPKVVQAGSGGDGKGVAEKELRVFANELRVLQRDDGFRYVNVDLFASEGVRRAADLQMLFPTQLYPVVSEHDGSVQQERALEDTAANTDEGVMASSQIHFLVSNFLPEGMGLFAPPSTSNADVPPPRTRIDALLPGTAVRMNFYYQHYKSKHLSGMTFLQFATSPSIVVNNYITRILSGQWEEGSPVTEAHLEIAKNVMSRKVHLWPLRGKEDMVLSWVKRHGWQEGGLDCMFSPTPVEGGQPTTVDGQPATVDGQPATVDGQPAAVDGQPATVEVIKPPPSELQLETNSIIRERNRLDDELYQYAMKLYNSRVKEGQIG